MALPKIPRQEIWHIRAEFLFCLALCSGMLSCIAADAQTAVSGVLFQLGKTPCSEGGHSCRLRDLSKTLLRPVGGRQSGFGCVVGDNRTYHFLPPEMPPASVFFLSRTRFVDTSTFAVEHPETPCGGGQSGRLHPLVSPLPDLAPLVCRAHHGRIRLAAEGLLELRHVGQRSNHPELPDRVRIG